jgi:ankyrin repeat protein
MSGACNSVCANTLQSPSDEIAFFSARVASRYTTKDPVDSAEVQRIISTVMSQNNISLVFEAVRTGDIEFVLLSRRLRPEWLHAMHEWTYTGGGDNESRRCTLLHEGVRRGHVGICDLLIASRVDVNAKNCRGETPLQTCIDPLQACVDNPPGSIKICKLLVESKADVNAGSPLLHLAFQSRFSFTDISLELVRMLAFCHGCDINATDKQLMTSLHHFVVFNHVEACRALLSARANLEAQDCMQRTPLHYVANLDVCQLLVTSKANLASRDCDGNTVLNLVVKYTRFGGMLGAAASSSRDARCVEYLKSMGAPE